MVSSGNDQQQVRLLDHHHHPHPAAAAAVKFSSARDGSVVVAVVAVAVVWTSLFGAIPVFSFSTGDVLSQWLRWMMIRRMIMTRVARATGQKTPVMIRGKMTMMMTRRMKSEKGTKAQQSEMMMTRMMVCLAKDENDNNDRNDDVNEWVVRINNEDDDIDDTGDENTWLKQDSYRW